MVGQDPVSSLEESDRMKLSQLLPLLLCFSMIFPKRWVFCRGEERSLSQPSQSLPRVSYYPKSNYK
jgi:hypothetical protein